MESSAFQLSRVYSQGWNAARKLLAAGKGDLDAKAAAARNPYRTGEENARWTKGNVVFATLNVPGPSGKSPSASETSARHAANVAWLNAAFDQAQAADSAAVMIIFQDDPFDGSADTSLMSTLKSRTTAFGKPVVLVHGDTHTFRIDHPWSGVPNFTRVETYGTGGTNKWIRATVDPSKANVFSFTTMTS